MIEQIRGKGGGSNIANSCIAYLLCYINQVEGREDYLGNDSDYACPTFDLTCEGLTSVSNICSMSSSPFEDLCATSTTWFVQKVAVDMCSGIV